MQPLPSECKGWDKARPGRDSARTRGTRLADREGALLALLALGCSSPTLTEGRESNINGSAPASRALVIAQAQRWFTAEIPQMKTSTDAQLSGYRTLADGRRVYVSLDVEGSGNVSAFRVHSHTEQMQNGAWVRSEANSNEAVDLANRLADQFSCAVAHWAGCP